jgi:hypothetical protein
MIMTRTRKPPDSSGGFFRFHELIHELDGIMRDRFGSEMVTKSLRFETGRAPSFSGFRAMGQLQAKGQDCDGP